MTDYIYEYKLSIPTLLCKTIIDLFDDEDGKREGSTLGGINTNIKKTTDFVIPKNNVKWEKIEKFLYEELHRNLKKYISSIEGNKFKNNYGMDYKIFENSLIFTETFMIQKYDKKKGRYIYHNDFSKKHESHRVITFLWYLNTIDQGGETVFWENFKIKPEEGKLILFPATWTYPHTGKMPISDNKYIITGWLNIKTT